MPARSSIERCDQLRDRVADAARRRLRHAGQLAIGRAHGLERQPGDAAAAAEAAGHQRLERHAALDQALLRQHDDQVLDLHRVGDGVAVGGVVDAPLVGRDPGLAALLADTGAADVRRDDLQVADLGRAGERARAHHPVPVGLEPGEDDVAGAQGGHPAFEVGVAVQVGLETAEQAVDPVAPVAGALRGGHLVGAHRAGADAWGHVGSWPAGRRALGAYRTPGSPSRGEPTPPGKPGPAVHRTASASACAGKHAGPARCRQYRSQPAARAGASPRDQGDADEPSPHPAFGLPAPHRRPRPGRRAGRPRLPGDRAGAGRAGAGRLRDRPHRARGPAARRSARSRTTCSGPSSRTPPAASTSRARSGRSSSSAPTTAATSRPACAPTRS